MAVKSGTHGSTERSKGFTFGKIMDYLTDFLDFCKYQRGLADNTIDAYRFEVSQYLDWIKTRGLRVNMVKVRDIDSFLISLRKKGENSIQTVNHKMYCLKTFYRWLQRIEVTKRNPLEVFQNSRTPKPLPRYLTQEEQEALLLASQNGREQKMNWHAKRDYLMTLFFLDTGVRVSELVNVKMENLNLAEGILKTMGKGSKEREVILSGRLLRAIQDYFAILNNIEVQNRLAPPGLPARGATLTKIYKDLNTKALSKVQKFIDDNIRPMSVKYLFFTSHGDSMDTRHVFRIVQEIGERAGIKNLHPHILRHTYASNLRMKGGDLLLIKEALGHASVMTTEIYAHINDGQYREKLRSLIN
jgi:site-specific recombinase XerD